MLLLEIILKEKLQLDFSIRYKTFVKKYIFLGYISLGEIFCGLLRFFEISKVCALGLLMRATVHYISIYLKYSLALEWPLFKLRIYFFELKWLGNEMVHFGLLDATEDANTG